MGSESETERKPEVPASTRDEALFHCTTTSGVPRGPYQFLSIPEVLGNPRVLLLVCITFSYRVCCLTITALRQRCSSLRNSAPDLLTEHASQPQKLSHPLHLLSRCANISSAQWSCQLPSCPLMHRHPRTAPGVRVILPALMGLPPHSTFEEDPVCGHMM